MANTKIIKRRIKSAKNISQITRAMEMVAASKMRRAQNQAVSSRPYSQSIRNILYSLLKSSTSFYHDLMKINASEKICLILISTQKGLCGGLNTNLFRAVKDFTSQFSKDKVIFLNIGKKGREFLVKSNYDVKADFTQISEKVVFEDTLVVSHYLINSYLTAEIGKAYVCFSNFVSTLSQKPKIMQILPITIDDIKKELGLLEKLEDKSNLSMGNKQYIIEPNAKQISDWLLPYFLELVIYHYLLEARAAEQSARMVAMKNASDNAAEIVAELTLSYNKERQSQITAQIAEVATANLAMERN